MFNAGVRGKRAKDSTGLITVGEHFNQQNFLIPNVTRFAVTDGSYVDTNDTAADTAGGQTIVLYGSGFAPGATILVGSTTIGAVTFLDSGRLAFSSPALGSGSYTIFVTNANGGTGILVPGLVYSGVPTFTTAAGSLGSVYETTAINTTVVATGDEPITYVISSGSLPPGSTLSSGGTISGTAPVDGSSTTYSFTIQATDADNQDSVRSFNLTINTDVVSFSSPANNTITSVIQNYAISNVTVTATSAAGYGVLYTSSGLPTGLSMNTSTGIISGTPTILASNVSIITATANTTNRNASLYLSWTINLPGDLFWKYTSLLLSANTLPNGNTFNTDLSTFNNEVIVVADTKPSEFHPFKEGYYSNYFDGTGDFLTSNNSAYTLGTNDFTIESWIYRFGTGAQKGIIDTGAASGSRLLMYITTNNKLNLFDGTNTWLTSNNTISANQWVHVAAARSSGTTKLFINGIQEASNTDSRTYANGSAGLYVGRQFGSTTNDWVGYISNLRIIKGNALYTANNTPSNTPLIYVANTVLLTCQSNRLIDNSNNNITFRKNGNTTVSLFSPFDGIPKTITVPDANATIITLVGNEGSAYLDGTGDYLSIPSGNQSSIFAFGTADYTMEAWIYPTATTASMRVFEFSGNQDNLQLNITSTGTISYFNGTTTTTSSAGLVTVNSWTHVALVRQSGTAKVYVDGVLAVTQGTTPNTTARTLWIGGLTSTPFQGYISNVRVNKGTALYTAAFTPPTAPLTPVTNTVLLTAQTNSSSNTKVFVDESNFNNIITPTGNTALGSFTPFGSTWSGYFDGTGDYLTTPSNSWSTLAGQFTVEFWINFSAAPAGAGGIVGTIGVTGGWQIYNDGTRITPNLAGTGNIFNSTFTTAGLTLGKWYHVAVTRDNANLMTMWVDGASVGSATTSTTYTQGVWQIGNSNFNCYISNFRSVNTCIYTDTFTPPTTPLTAISGTSLLTCQSNRFIDNSTNNFAVTRLADTVVSKFSPFSTIVNDEIISYSANTFGSSIFFDNYAAASVDYLSVSGIPISATGQFTFEAWLYTTAVNSADNGMIYSQYTTSDANRWTIVLNTSNKIQVTHPSLTVIGATTFPPYQWNHVAVTRDASNTLRIFLNGVVDVTSSSYTYSIMQSPARVGYYNNTPNDYWNGFMSSVRVVNGQALYTSAFTPSDKPLPPTSNTTLLLASTVGPSVTDATRNHNIETFGTARYVANNSPYYDTYSGYFDGTGDYLTIDNSASFNLISDFTFECWIYNSSVVSGETHIFGKRASTAVYSQIIFGLNVSSSVNKMFVIGTTASGSWNIPYTLGSITLPIGQWNHISLVRSGTTIKTYVNGVVDITLTGVTGSFFTNTDAMTIGTSTTDGSAGYYTGYISNFRFVNGTAVYAANFTPPTTPLTAVANTSLLACQSNRFVDNSTNAFTITKAGNVRTTALQPFAANNTSRFSSVYFPVKTDVLAIEPDPSLVRFSGDFTLECWVYPTDTTITTWGIWDSRNAAASANPMAFTLDPLASAVAGSYRMAYYNGTKYYGTTTVFYNQWTHVAWVRSGTTMTFYVNGVAGGTATISGAQIGNVSSTPIYIGTKDNGSAGYGTNGYISDLRITNGYARTITVPTTPYDIK
jgi:hypothetical protein